MILNALSWRLVFGFLFEFSQKAKSDFVFLVFSHHLIVKLDAGYSGLNLAFSYFLMIREEREHLLDNALSLANGVDAIKEAAMFREGLVSTVDANKNQTTVS